MGILKVVAIVLAGILAVVAVITVWEIASNMVSYIFRRGFNLSDAWNWTIEDIKTKYGIGQKSNDTEDLVTYSFVNKNIEIRGLGI